jgi:hypothetical protein
VSAYRQNARSETRETETPLGRIGYLLLVIAPVPIILTLSWIGTGKVFSGRSAFDLLMYFFPMSIATLAICIAGGLSPRRTWLATVWWPVALARIVFATLRDLLRSLYLWIRYGETKTS